MLQRILSSIFLLIFQIPYWYDFYYQTISLNFLNVLQSPIEIVWSS